MVFLIICVSTKREFTTNASDIKAAMLIPMKGDRYNFYPTQTRY